MERTKFLGRVGGIAVGLGIGSAMAAMPWMASADVIGQLTPDIGSAIDVLPFAAAAGSTPDFAISYDGMSLLQEGTASATTVTGNFGLAIAYGDGSRAFDNGMYGDSYANGTDSTSYIGGGTNNISIANGADSITNVNGDNNFVDATGYQSNASAVFGNGNSVIADGAGSQSQVLGLDGGGDNNLVSVFGANSLADTSGSNSILDVVGNNDIQASTDGMNNIAAIFGDGSMAQAAGGDGNIAGVFGDGSTAFAGLGNNGLALAFGDLLSAYAPAGYNRHRAVDVCRRRDGRLVRRIGPGRFVPHRLPRRILADQLVLTDTTSFNQRWLCPTPRGHSQRCFCRSPVDPS